ncbi:restriction endonuclease subunit S [Carnobacterium maltaromaticum]|uniref:restriction endonuclease subunit S n=1 Tax=Carnobacterium maltaromaticum TaxID=2751 RepID=UPI00295EC196|nr:restriction endonuclease subunit S [Carnobacterium maltaromaticum]
MKDEKKNMPKVRFSGFSDAWELRKLSTEFEKVNERNDGSLGKEHWISVAKMYFQNPDKVQSNNIDTRTYVMRTGDIAFEGHPNKEFKFGRFVANDIGRGVVSELFPIYRHKQEYNNYYWKNAIQIERVMGPIFAKSITSSGNSSNKLDPNHFLRQQVFIPKIEEQNKIGMFFKQFDDTVALHQRKLEALKEMKKGFLQQLFPQKGEKVPRVRFADFHDEWELRKVLEMSKESFGGGTPKTGNEEYWQGNFPWIQSSDIIKEQLYNVKPTKFITEEAIKNSATKVIPGNSIAIVTRVGVGKLALISFAFATSQDFISLSKLNVDNYFGVYSLYQMLQKQLNNIQGTSIKGITKKELLEKKLQIPLQIDEQQNIGTFFKQADNTIILQQNKLEQLKILKKTYLQNMFI